MEGLSPQRERALSGDDARYQRVHPPLPHARAAPRLTSHPLLRATSPARATNIERARQLLATPLLPIDALSAASADSNPAQTPQYPCPCCGGSMLIIERFERGATPHYRPSASKPTIRIDTS